MRISTLQIFEQPLQTMMRQQSTLQQTESQIATGLRILKPSDDPSASVKILGLEDNIAVIDQYMRNATLADGRLSMEESTLDSVVSRLQRVRELTVQAANASQTPESRKALSAEMFLQLQGMVDLANSSDSQGKYIFAGSKDSAPPFANSTSGVNYVGDQLQRMLQVGEGSRVVVRDSGDDVFLRIPSGNGDVEVRPSPTNQGNLVVGKYGVSGNFTSANYTINFSQALPDDPVTYTVVDDDAAPATVVASGTYKDNYNIQFAGLGVIFGGTPQDGDSFNVAPSTNRSLFETVQAIAEALDNAPTSPTAQTAFNNEMNLGLNNLDQALLHVTGVRASIGGRLNTIEQQNNVNEDFKVELKTVLSDTRDVDYAEAISRFNLQLTSLQAAQQAYIKVQGLSLFKFL